MITHQELLKLLDENLSIPPLERLSQRGIKLTDKTETGDTLLHVLFREDLNYKTRDFAHLVLDQAVIDINAVNKEGETCFDCLMKSKTCYKKEFGMRLITSGLLSNRENQSENTPLQTLLHYAPPYMEELSLDLLRNNKVDTAIRLASGKTYLHLLLEKKNVGVYKELFESLVISMERQGINTLAILLETVNPIESYYFMDCLKRILKNGGNLYDCNAQGELVIARLFHVDTSQNFSHSLSYRALIKKFFEQFPFDFGKEVAGQSALQRLKIGKIQDQEILKIILKEALKSGDIIKKEIRDFCANNKTGRVFLVLETLKEDIDNMDFDFLQNEENSIFNEILKYDAKLEKMNVKSKSQLAFDTKMLGHRFSLKGSVPVPKELAEFGESEGLVSLTGNSNLKTALAFAQSIKNYLEHFHTEMPKEYRDIFQTIYQKARQALRCRMVFDGFQYDESREKMLESLLEDCKHDIALIHTGYSRHSVSLVIVEGRLLYRGNKGGCNFGNDVVEQYKITQPEGLTTELLRKLLKEDYSEKNKSLIHKEIHQILGLELVDVKKGKLQTVGNCSWASKKCGMRALIHHLVNARNIKIADVAEQLFKSWTYFDRSFALNQYVHDYSDSRTLPFVLRRILCTHIDINEKDLELGKKCMERLRSLPNFEEGMVEFLIKHWQLGKGKNGVEKQKQFSEFMQQLGVHLHQSFTNYPVIVRAFAATLQNDTKQLSEILNSGIASSSLNYLGWTPLHLACGNENLALVEAFIKFAPTWVNCSNIVKRTPLFYVREECCAKALVAAGANINYCFDYEVIPLNTAVAQGNLPLVQWFLANGAKPNHETLHSAARSGCINMGETLLKFDPKLIQSQSYDYDLPIHTAAKAGHQDFAQLLLRYGSPVSSPDVNGNTPIHHAARNNKEPVLRMLASVPTCGLSVKNHQNRNLLAFTIHQSDQKLHHELTRSLGECEKATHHYESVFVPDRRMALLKTPEQTLFGAVRVGDMTAVAGCLAKFPQLNINAIVEPFASTILHEAIQRGHNKIFDLLLKIPNININVGNGCNERPLHIAIITRNMYVLETLLQLTNIDVNAPGDFDYTPLHEAAERGNREAVKRLLVHPKLDSTLLNINGKRADEVAKKYYVIEDDVVKMISEHLSTMSQNKAGNTLT